MSQLLNSKKFYIGKRKIPPPSETFYTPFPTSAPLKHLDTYILGQKMRVQFRKFGVSHGAS